MSIFKKPHMSKHAKFYNPKSRNNFERLLKFNTLLKQLLWFEYQERLCLSSKKWAFMDIDNILFQEKLIHWDLQNLDPKKYKSEVANPHGF